MNNIPVSLLIVILFTVSAFCRFGERVDCGEVDNSEISEASGIAASRVNKGVLWVHNDSGDKARVFALSQSAKNIGTFYLDGINARDCEDIAVGPGPEAGKTYVYLGDIGDNKAVYDVKMIYRFEEPVVDTAKAPGVYNVSKVDILRFKYNDGMRDAEALMVDPLTKDCYVISKRELNVRVYRFAYPQDTAKVSTISYLDSLKNMSVIVAADISPDGSEILIKDYHEVYYWKKKPNESVINAMGKKTTKLPYIKEMQGEGVCWAVDSKGYFTISEKRKKQPCHLYFYPRIP